MPTTTRLQQRQVDGWLEHARVFLRAHHGWRYVGFTLTVEGRVDAALRLCNERIAGEVDPWLTVWKIEGLTHTTLHFQRKPPKDVIQAQEDAKWELARRNGQSSVMTRIDFPIAM